MSGSVEIYICKEGQALKEGKLEVSHDIFSKEDAIADAKERCKYDKTAFKIAYYKEDAQGNYKIFYTYNNPYFEKREMPEKQKGVARRRPKTKPPAKPDSFMDKMLKGLGGACPVGC